MQEEWSWLTAVYSNDEFALQKEKPRPKPGFYYSKDDLFEFYHAFTFPFTFAITSSAILAGAGL